MANTLRLLMPQWQGGNNPAYSLGARLLAWLAPSSEEAALVEVPVEPHTGEALPLENGVVGHSVLLRQLRSATSIIEAHRPDRIVVFGGDCLVAQAPFAYLNEKHGGKLGVLWLDAHPDISTPEMHRHVHAMVLGNLLGEGEPGFAAEVKVPLQPELVMYGGLQPMTLQETAVVNRLRLRGVGPRELADTSRPVLDWIQEKQIRHLAIHLDLDVLDPALFRSLLFAEPGAPLVAASSGAMTLAQVARLLRDVSKQAEVVGLAIAEHLPWDAIHLRDFLGELPIFS